MAEANAVDRPDQPRAPGEEHADLYPEILGFILVSTWVDLLAPLVVELSPWIALSFWGAVAGQVAVWGLWSVFSSLFLPKRIALALIGLAWMTGCMIASSAALHGVHAHFEAGSPRAFAFLPLLLLATQTPFWLARFFFRWSIKLAMRGHVTDRRSAQFSIAQLLAATTFLGVALGLTRLGISGRPELDTLPMLFGVLFLALAWAVWVVLIAIPCAWMVLSANRRLAGLVWFWLATSLLLFPVVTFAAAVFNGAALMVISCCLTVARWNGYRLVRALRRV